jgi:multidrug efflux pump subunit AcrA (membrane-fusion protein)
MKIARVIRFVVLKRMGLLSVLSLFLISCGESQQIDNIKISVSKRAFTIKIPAMGELEAANSTNISMPVGVFEPQVIEWLAEENITVKKGQVVARFDSKKYNFQSQQEQFNIDKSNVSYQTKEEVLLNEKGEITSDKSLVSEELAIANAYSSENQQVFSRNEIIDSMKNKQYLEAKREYIGWRGESHNEKYESELELLRLQRGQHSAKLDMYTSALGKLEITAPHDGLFVLKKNWRGEKARVGDTTWPGRKIASLPDLSKLQAKIFILEAEAAGIKVNQRVELALDAYPDEIIDGEIQQLDSVAKPIDNGSPVKYFEAIVSINKENSSYWRPGSQLQATIFVAELADAISIPTQSIISESGKYFVMVEDGSDWEKREVKIGKRSAAKTEITQGIEADEVIALFSENIDLENRRNKNEVL